MTGNSEKFDAATAEVERRVAEGRRDGRYPIEIDEQLLSEFARQPKDPLWFNAVDRLPERAAELRSLVFGRGAIEYTSSLPGGSVLHKAVGKVVSRQIAAIAQQLNKLSDELARAVDDTHGALDEMRSVIRGDLLGDIDAVHLRLAQAERKIAQLEAKLAERDRTHEV